LHHEELLTLRRNAWHAQFGKPNYSRRPYTGLEDMIRIILRIAGYLLLLTGVVWFLQGINVLPGSFMTGRTEWAVYGVIAVAAGIVLIVLANRRTNSPRRG
jgi:hypothetical protein